MVVAQLIKLFFYPKQGWEQIFYTPPKILSVFFLYLAPFAFLPTLALYFGLTHVGWQIAPDSPIHFMDSKSAKVVCSGAFISTLIGIYIMSHMIKWMAPTYDAKPTFEHCLALTTHAITPLFIFGIAGVYPQVWFLTLASLLAITFSVYYLFKALPLCMNIPKDEGFVYSCSILCVVMIGMVTFFVVTVILWENGLQPIYQ